MLPRIFLDFYTSSKLENKHMQCRNANNMKLKRLLLKTLTLSWKCDVQIKCTCKYMNCL